MRQYAYISFVKLLLTTYYTFFITMFVNHNQQTSMAVPLHFRRKLPIDWDACPCEVYSLIFRKLEARDLISCLLVNRRWRSIIENDPQLDWRKIAEEGLCDVTTIFKASSNLEWRNFVIKRAQWIFGIKSLEVKGFHTYIGEEDYLPTMAVYKDKLYVCTKTHAECFNIEKCEVTRLEPQHREMYFADESDHIRLLYDGKLKLRLIGKKCADDDGPTSPDTVVEFVSNDHLIYALEQNHCHILSKNQYLWCYIWENQKWESKFIARYFGTTGFSAMVARNKRLYLLGKHGDLWMSSVEERRFTKIASFTMPMFYHPANSVAVLNTMLSVCPKDDFKYVAKEISKIFVKGVTCATYHAGVLLVAFSDGQIQAIILASIGTDKTSTTFGFWDTFSSVGTSSFSCYSEDFGNRLSCRRHCLRWMHDCIYHMAVYEGDSSCYLFVNCSHSIYQFALTNPEFS